MTKVDIEMLLSKKESGQSKEGNGQRVCKICTNTFTVFGVPKARAKMTCIHCESLTWNNILRHQTIRGRH